jgi:hypothetical protein
VAASDRGISDSGNQQALFTEGGGGFNGFGFVAKHDRNDCSRERSAPKLER